MTRKLLLTALAFTMGIGLLWSQRPKQADRYDVSINGYSVSLQSDLNQFQAKPQVQRSGIVKEEPEWIVIQFNEIPTVEERSSLASRGIDILSYVGGNAYYASVAPRTQTLIANNVRAFAAINPQLKINPLLNGIAIPDYIKDGDMLKIVIIYFENADPSDIEKDLKQLGLNNVIMEPYFHFIRVSVPEDLLPDLSALGWVQSIQPADPPMEPENLQSRNLHRANILQSTIPGLGYGLTGKGIKIGLWDTDVEYHRDFNDRLTVREFEYHSSDHGAHTAGTLISAGVIDPRAKGMAPEAEIVAYNFNTQSNNLTVPQERLLALNNDGIMLSSNSYGVTPSNCNNASARYAYNTTDVAEDQLARDFPYFLIVYSAGNSQQLAACASIGGYFTTTKNIKNALVVANVSAMEEISSSSSFGPTFDGRLIPNISGDGSSIYSTIFDNSYGLKSGTSMATPGVAGTAALLYQRYKETHNNQLPPSSLMRALMYNTAHDLGNPGPDYIFGYGAINGVRAIEVMEKGTFLVESVDNNATFTKNIDVPAGASALRVMLVWTDEKGMIGTFPLINDLDLSVATGGNTFLPWVLDRNNPSAPAIRGIDTLNNMEQVTIDNPQQGTYTIKVDGYSVPSGSQEFALVYDIVMPTLKITYPIGGESLNPNAGNQIVVRWDCEGYKDPFTVEYSEDGGASYKIIGDNIPNTYRAFLWTMPDDMAITDKAKFRVRCGMANHASKGFVNIMPTPKNFTASPVQCSGVGTATLQWGAIPNAKYQVLKVTGQEYNVIAEVTTNTFTITNPVQGNDSWYSVRAIDNTTGAISERAVAVQVNPADVITSLPFKEDFETQTAENFYFTSTTDYGIAKIDFIIGGWVNPTYNYGIVLTGAPADKGDWVASTGADCFTDNPSYVTSATICNVDATSMLGKQMRLKFDYRKKNNAYFRVKVNGTVIASTEGTEVYGATDQESYKTLFYNIDAFAGSPTVSITFEAVCKESRVIGLDSNGNKVYGDSDDSGDFIAIDNISISDLSPDLYIKLLTIASPSGEMPIGIIVRQNKTAEELTPLYNIPVSYQINDGLTINEVIPGPLADNMIIYTFDQEADFSAPGLYTITASVNFPTDLITDNNTETQTIANNTGYFHIGATNYGGDAQTKTLANGEKLTITHPNGPFFDYKRIGNSVPYTTFTPPTGKNIKFTLTQIDIDKDVDHIRIHNNTPTNIIATYTGQIVSDDDITISSAYDGSMTVQIYAIGALGNSKGFIGTIECVDRPVIDIGVDKISNPVSGIGLSDTETITTFIRNFGQQTVRDINIYYQLNDETPVSETISTILFPAATISHDFTALADLSAPGTHTLKVWVETAGDEDDSNNSATISVENIAVLKDAGTIAIDDIYLYRTSGKTSSIRHTTKNIGNIALASPIPMRYIVNNNPPVNANVNITGGVLRAGYQFSHTFITKASLPLPNAHTIKVYPEISGDMDHTNDTTIITVETQLSSTSTTGRFNGSTIAATGVSSMDLTTDYTVEFWINPLRTPTFGRIFDKTNVAIFYQGNPRYSTAYPENTYVLAVTTDIGSFTYYYPNTVRQGEWQHIALTVDATGAIYKFYIDGIEQTPTVYTGTPAAAKSNSDIPLYIGNNAALTRGVVGDIDEVRVWDSCLPQATIVANMVADFPTDAPDLLAYYKFKEDKGGYVFDHSVNDNTAIVKGANTSGKGEGYFWNEVVFMTDVSFGADQILPTVYNPATKTFTILVDPAADLTSLVNTYTVYMHPDVKVGGTLQVSGVTANDFSGGPVRYDVEGVGFNSGITQTYYVDVKHDNLSNECELFYYNFAAAHNPSLAGNLNLTKNVQTFGTTLPFGTALSSLKASFAVSPGAKAYIAGTEQQSPQATALNYNQPVVVTVVAENLREAKVYTIDLNTSNTYAELLDYGLLNEQLGTTEINPADCTVKIWVKNTTNLAMLTPTFTVSPNAILCIGTITQISGQSLVNFTSPVSVSIISEDGQTVQNWTVTVMQDNIKPKITLIGDAEEAIALGSVYMDQGATAFDNADGDITANIVTTGAVDVNTGGIYTISYNVTDAAGNVADEVTRTVEVVVPSELASVDQLLIDGVEHNISLTYIMSCSGSNLLNIEIVGNGTLADLTTSTGTVNQTGAESFTLLFDKPSIATISFNMLSESGNTVEAYQLVVVKQFAFDDIVVQKWNNTLMLNLKALREMGYSNVSDVKWYKDGVQIGTGNSYSAGSTVTDLLTFSSLYSVELTVGGQILHSCAQQPTQQKVNTIAYPNPVAKGGKLTVSLDESILQQTDVVANFYDMMGVRKSRQSINVNRSSITAPSAAGIYILELRSDTDVIATMKIIVQ